MQERFGAYMRTLRWDCVTATNPGLFQSPFRAGIKIESYQLEPLATALKLPLSGLQQRLLSFIEAFARTLKVQRRGIAAALGAEPTSNTAKTLNTTREPDLLIGLFDAEDERAQLEPDDQAVLLAAAMAQASENSAGNLTQQALDLLTQLGDVAEAARYQPEARVRYLLAWLKQHCCPGMTVSGITVSG